MRKRWRGLSIAFSVFSVIPGGVNCGILLQALTAVPALAQSGLNQYQSLNSQYSNLNSQYSNDSNGSNSSNGSSGSYGSNGSSGASGSYGSNGSSGSYGANGSSASALTRIIPAASDAIGGGNPLQGLGRPDESAPSRRSQFESSDSGSQYGAGAQYGLGSGGSQYSQNGAGSAYSGSSNPNIPPDLPPPPSVDPIEMQRDQEDKEREAEELKKKENSARDREEAAKIPNPAIDTPLKKAMLELHLQNYDGCIGQLDGILLRNPKDAQAHYLKAVVYVLTRKYDDAEKEYKQVLSGGVASERLTQKARVGLAKINR